MARKTGAQKKLPAIVASQSTFSDYEPSSKSWTSFFGRNSVHQPQSFQQVYVVSSFAISSTRLPQRFLKHVSSPYGFLLHPYRCWCFGGSNFFSLKPKVMLGTNTEDEAIMKDLVAMMKGDSQLLWKSKMGTGFLWVGGCGSFCLGSNFC